MTDLARPFPHPFPGVQYFDHDGLRLAYYEAGEVTDPVVVLLHGWPEIAYSWAHQIHVLADAGFHVVAPDLRGFGRSSAPQGKEHYAIAQMVGDVEALLDHLGAARATVIGHDWGGIITWWAARMLGERVERVASICTPLVKTAPVDPLKIFERRFGEDHYFLVFNREPERVAELFARDADAFFRLMFRTVPGDYEMGSAFTHIPKSFAGFLDKGAPEVKGAVLSEAQRAVFVEAYERSGFHGGVALYRNTTENWELEVGPKTKMWERFRTPALMVSPEDDRLLPPGVTDHMPAMCAELKRVQIADCGHWAMWGAAGGGECGAGGVVDGVAHPSCRHPGEGRDLPLAFGENRASHNLLPSRWRSRCCTARRSSG